MSTHEQGDTKPARDYAFYEAGQRERPRRLAWLVLPLRRLLRRLLGPVWAREELLFQALADDITRVERRLDAAVGELRSELTERHDVTTSYLTDRLAELERQIHAAAALGWDHVAVTRRLAALEDHLALLNETEAREASTADGSSG